MSDMQRKTALVLGASGLIGEAICQSLGKTADIHIAQRSQPILKGQIAAADYIVHAAGYAQPQKFMADPLETIRLNTSVVLDIVNNMKPEARFLYLSTSEVYSGSSKILHHEEDIGTTRPTNARGCYIESKRCGEAIVHAARNRNIHPMIARVSLVYGPGTRLDDKRVLNEFVMQAARGEQIMLKDGGSARRTYCYISDATEMLVNILLKGKQDVYNVGGMGEISIYGLARKIAELAGTSIKVPRNSGQAIEGAPAHVGLDINRYIREFGAKNFVPLEDGLAKTIEWYRKLMAEPKGRAA